MKSTYDTYVNAKKLDNYGYIIMSDELLLHRAFSFLMYSNNLEKDTVKFFKLAPLPDVACIFRCAEEVMKTRTLMRNHIPNCYNVGDDKKFDEIIKKTVPICNIAENILKERKIEVISVDLSDNVENNVQKVKIFLDKNINTYKNNHNIKLYNKFGNEKQY